MHLHESFGWQIDVYQDEFLKVLGIQLEPFSQFLALEVGDASLDFLPLETRFLAVFVDQLSFLYGLVLLHEFFVGFGFSSKDP